MTWDSIEIVDQSGITYEGETARQFVEKNCLPGKVCTSKWGNISIEYATGHWSYQSPIIRVTLWELLKDKVQTIKNLDRVYGTREPFIPRKKTTNLLNIKPEYIIELRLGDLDALFDPVTVGADPWKQECVRQRLQVLGYLYTPLRHSKIEQHAEKCWSYYRRIHEQKRGIKLSDEKLLELLKLEVRNNILAPSLPVSGQVFENNSLPAMGEFAALRFPGAYCLNYPRPGGKDEWDGELAQDARRPVNRPTDGDAKYDFSVLDDTYRAEDALVLDNPLLGKIPLVATVHKRLHNGTTEPAKGIYVYFQLIEPGTLPQAHPLCAPEPRNTVMDYSLDPSAFDAWQKVPIKPLIGDPYSQVDWDKAKELANEFFREAEKECKVEIQKLYDEAATVDKKVKAAKDKSGKKTRDYSETNGKYNKAQEDALGELRQHFNAAKEASASKEKACEDMEGNLRKMKGFIAPRPALKLNTVRKSTKPQSEIDRDRQLAEEKANKKVEYERQIPLEEEKLKVAQQEMIEAQEKLKLLELKFKDAEALAAQKNPHREDLERAREEKDEAEGEKEKLEHEAKEIQERAKKIMEDR